MFFRKSLPVAEDEPGSAPGPRFHYLGDQPREVTTHLRGYNYAQRARGRDGLYKMESGEETAKRAPSGGICNWRVLRWIILPALVLILLSAAVTTLIYATTDRRDTSNETAVKETLFDESDGQILEDLEADSTLARGAGRSTSVSPALQGLLSFQGKEKPDDWDKEEAADNRLDREETTTEAQEMTTVGEESSFIERLMARFGETGPAKGLTVKEFTSLGETGLRRRPNGHKYPEYQVGPGMTREAQRSTTALPVSPTLPSLVPRGPPSPTHLPSANISENACHSPQLEVCRGVIPWDLTTVPSLPGTEIRSVEALAEAMPYFELVLDSGCSPRARAFLCSLLEPECQPYGKATVPPCRSICRMVAEDCGDFILDNLDLSKVFQCENYPESDDPNECVNFARGQSCSSREMRCADGTCIHKRWRCNGERDCRGGSDEVNCTQCTNHQFSCESREECVPMEWRCDGNRDCKDGSDEEGCNGEEEMRVHSHASPCPAGELRCVDGRCITLQQICDGRKDCSDGADEASCAAHVLPLS